MIVNLLFFKLYFSGNTMCIVNKSTAIYLSIANLNPEEKINAHVIEKW